MELGRGRADGFSITTKQGEVWRRQRASPCERKGGAAAGAPAGCCWGVEIERMFDKVVTPSDVGKLNRLVIPKQHAEKHFPLGAGADRSGGVLLAFEDCSGEFWHFRYCYWSSSQSYVMTKGWSRFVKEKGLGTGDTVCFGRGVGDSGRNRLFIDWKRRPESRPLRGLVSLGQFFMPPPQLQPPPASVVLYNVVAPTADVPQVVFFPSPANVLRPVQVQPPGGSIFRGSEPANDRPPGDGGRQARDKKGVWLFGVNLLASQRDVAGGSSDFTSSLESSEAAALRPPSVESSEGSSSSLDSDSRPTTEGKIL